MFGYLQVDFASTTYTLTIRYVGGGVGCNAGETDQTLLGPVEIPASTTVPVLVSLDTADGRLALHDGVGTLEAGGAGVSLEARWNVATTTVMGGICANGSNFRFDLTGTPASSTRFIGDLLLSCDVPNGLEAASVGTFE
jgi:hypothetical protein